MGRGLTSPKARRRTKQPIAKLPPQPLNPTGVNPVGGVRQAEGPPRLIPIRVFSPTRDRHTPLHQPNSLQVCRGEAEGRASGPLVLACTEPWRQKLDTRSLLRVLGRPAIDVLVPTRTLLGARCGPRNNDGMPFPRRIAIDTPPDPSCHAARR